MSGAAPIACFRNVTKTYDGVVDVVRALNLDVARGEFLTLLGPPGSGKTTTLMMLAGFQAPTSGDILLEGENVNRVPPHKRGLGVVFPSDALFPHMSVAENVAFPLTIRRVGRAERDEKVTRALALVRLTGLAERRPARLSGGQRLRVALARALVYAPELVLLDEPLGALERALREELRMEIRHIHRELGVSMLYVTHDQTEALVLSDRIAVFDRGVVRQLAAPEILYEDPANAFVARVIGDNNRLNGRIIGIEDEIAQVKLQAGPVVEARIADARRVGELCVVSVRPERVALAATTARDMGENALSAVVLEVVYLGDHLRVRLTVGEDTELIVKRPAAAGLGGLAVGQPAAVAWQGYHARAFLMEV